MADPTSLRVAAAVRAWRDALGTERVLAGPAATERYGNNVTEFCPRVVPAVLSARTRAEVQRVVGIANEHGVPIYPMSTGKNWGVGSKLPVEDGCALLDLRSMNKVRAVSEPHAYAVVEPGVTQRQLRDHLDTLGSGLVFNVTGSGESTSLVGNALERGVGMFGQRHRDVRALEVVTGSGRVVRTGLWHAWNEEVLGPCPHHHPAGLGPDLTGLFLQSNFGVVTAVAIDLVPRRPFALALLRAHEARLPEVVNAVARLRLKGLLADRIEIDGEDDPRLDGLARSRPGEPVWWIWAVLWGDSGLVAPVRDALERAVLGLCDDPLFFDDRMAAADELPPPVRARLRRFAGEPSNDGVDALARASGVAVTSALDIDDEPAILGFVCALPAVPMRGDAVTHVLEIVRSVGARTRVSPCVSFNTVSAHAFEGYARVTFDRRDRMEIDRAHAWSRDVHRELATAGFFPMRLDVQRMKDFPADLGDDFWGAAASIKRALDPKGIIAPGRYVP